MASLLAPEFSYENLTNDACSCTIKGMWQLLNGKKIEGAAENARNVEQIRAEVNSFFTILPDIINDVVGRKKVWNRLFGNVAMPSPEEGSIGKSHGILDSRFPSADLTGEEVLRLLKKSKK
jgi:hypothetical protein